MAFPTVAATNTSQTAAGATSHPISMPAGITAGDLLLAIIFADAALSTTPPSGWSKISSIDGLYYKVAAGSDTCTATTTEGSPSVHVSYRITGYSGDPEAARNALSSGTGDPPSLNPSAWDAEDTLWIAGAGAFTSGVPSAAPTNYGNLVSRFDGVELAIGTARRELNVASENPGTFTWPGGADVRGAFTIAIRPAAAGGGSAIAAIQHSYRQRRI